MTVQRYRKRPVVIEAIQFTGGAVQATRVIDWVLAGDGTARWMEERGASPEIISVETLEGTMHAFVGDWIIRGVAGEFYPCKPDIFEATYERVAPPPSAQSGDLWTMGAQDA